MTGLVQPKPADFFCVRSFGPAGGVISTMEKIAGPSGVSEFTHSGIYVGGLDFKIVEAEWPRIRCRSLMYRDHALFQRGDQLTLWSTGAIDLTDAERGLIVAAALGYAGQCEPDKGVRYSGLDYLAIAEHRAHLPDLPWHFRDGRWVSATQVMADTAHMICSQTVVQCWLDGGVDLLPGQLPGNVMPSDLAKAVMARPRWGLPRVVVAR